MEGRYELLKDPVAESTGSGQRSRRRLLFTALLLSATIAISLLYASPPGSRILFDDEASVPSRNDSVAPGPLAQCPAALALGATPPAPVNLWASLTVAETTQIHDWLFHPSRGLNLTLANNATHSDNSIFLIEVYRPAKADALAYLETPIEGKLPPRYSRVSVHLGARAESNGGPVIKDYLVGPLPVGTHTTIEELKGIYHREEIPYNARGFAVPTEFTPLLITYMPRLAHVTQVFRLILSSTNY